MNFCIDALEIDHPAVIFREQSLADQMVQAVDGGKAVSLTLPHCFDEETSSSYVTIRFITTLDIVYSFISSFAMAALQIDNNTNNDSTNTKFFIKKVGQSSGDIMLQIHGEEDKLPETMRVFFTNSRSRDGFKIHILGPRAIALNPPTNKWDIKFEFSTEPYGLVPGNLITLYSSDISRLYSWAISLSRITETTDTSFSLMRFRVSPNIVQEALTSRKMNKEVEENNLLEDNKKDTDEPDEFKLGVKLVELTKREITYLIGKKGRRIEEIRKQTTAIIKVVPISRISDQNMFNNPLATQFLRVSGTNKEVRKALKIIEADIYQFRANGITAFY